MQDEVMSGLRNHVAQAIAHDATCGGPGILATEEQDALLRGAMLLAASGQTDDAALLRAIAVELGAKNTPFIAPATRVDAYFLHCADVATAAYEGWIAQAAREIACQAGKADGK